jgi:type I restriction enzyme M protein
LKTHISQQQLESYLWGAATLLRGTIDAGDYKQFIFPLLFFKRLCDVFDEETKLALKESGGDVDFAAYPENHRFQVPRQAQWFEVRQTSNNVGKALQSAMRAIEKANPDKLYGIFGDAQWTNKDRLPDAMLRDLIEHFSSLELTVANLPEDELGQGYEYLIKKFADDSGHTAAEFYTNRTVVHLMTEMLEPQSGESIYDPTCGSGGMLLSCITHLRRQEKEWRNVRLYGQERNLMTSSIARMNCFLHGIEDFQIVRGDTLSEPKLVEGDRLMRFDVVLANPPYSIKQWDRDAFASDPWGRNLYGTPPQGRADYAFWQHILQSLNPKTGRCAILFPHGVLFRQEEAEMRRKLIEADVVECVLGLGPNLFYNSPMEACVVVCRMKKPKARRGHILFINAVNEVTRERAQSFLTDEHIHRIADAYVQFKDVPAFAHLANVEDIREQGWSLNIPLYISGGQSRRSKERLLDTSMSEVFQDWLDKSQSTGSILSRLLGKSHNLAQPSSRLTARISTPKWLDRTKWAPRSFDEIAENVKETGQPTVEDSERYIGLEHMDSDSLNVRRFGSHADLKGQKLRMRKGDILFAKRNAYLRRVAISPHDGFFSAHGMVLRAKTETVSAEFLPFFMMNDKFMNRAIEISVGSLSPTINWSTLKLEEFELPPLDQQQRLAEILQAADDVEEKWLNLSQTIQEAYNAQFKALALGTSGFHSRISNIDHFSPPDGWIVRPAKDLVASPITKGATPSLKLNTGDATVPFLKVYNLTFSGNLDFSVDPTYVEREVHEAELRRSQVRAGDILMNIVGPPLGKTAMIPEGFPESNVNQAIAIYRIEDAAIREYFFEYLRTKLAQGWLERRSKKTSGQQNLTLEVAQDLPVPMPPPDVLLKVNSSARTFALLKKEMASVLLAISRLRQSIRSLL